MTLLRNLQLLSFLLLLSFSDHALSFFTHEVRVIHGLDDTGHSVLLRDARKPSIYTGDFGDCLGQNYFTISQFYAAFYRDNMTVTFHIEGSSALNNDNIMMYIGVFAYGQSRFNISFNPCKANILNACPVKAFAPIRAHGVIPVSKEDLRSIPNLAFSIPDLEGQAILRIFSNSTQTEVACYSAVITNGTTISQPFIMGPLLALFTLISILASFATSIAGNDLSTINKHRTHALSVQVIFAVFHHIFFSGSLSINWPKILVAFWSNYSWTAGMVSIKPIRKQIERFVELSANDPGVTGTAATGKLVADLENGFNARKIYETYQPNFERENYPHQLPLNKHSPYHTPPYTPHQYDPSQYIPTQYATPQFTIPQYTSPQYVPAQFITRDTVNLPNEVYPWRGKSTKLGTALPGNYSGFAGLLSQENIPVANAFSTGATWFLLSLVITTIFVVFVKWSTEGLIRLKITRNRPLKIFRRYWIRCTAIAIFKTISAFLYAISFLSLIQIFYLGSHVAKILATAVLAAILLIIYGVIAFTFVKRLKTPALVWFHLRFETRYCCLIFPWIGISWIKPGLVLPRGGINIPLPCIRISEILREKNLNVQQAEEKQAFGTGWLTSRYRHTRWWFSLLWPSYELMRAGISAGAVSYPKVQIFCLIAVELIAFIFMSIARPYESQRINVLVIYVLSLSKIATLILAIFLTSVFQLSRIAISILGIVILVIHGFLTFTLICAIVVGVIKSYVSITRNKPTRDPESDKGNTSMRDRFFIHVDGCEKHSNPCDATQVLLDSINGKSSKLIKPPRGSMGSEVKAVETTSDSKIIGESFQVRKVRRIEKIEDEHKNAYTCDAILDSELSVETRKVKVLENVYRDSYSDPNSPRKSIRSFTDLVRSSVRHSRSVGSFRFKVDLRRKYSDVRKDDSINPQLMRCDSGTSVYGKAPQSNEQLQFDASQIIQKPNVKCEKSFVPDLSSIVIPTSELPTWNETAMEVEKNQKANDVEIKETDCKLVMSKSSVLNGDNSQVKEKIKKNLAGSSVLPSRYCRGILPSLSYHGLPPRAAFFRASWYIENIHYPITHGNLERERSSILNVKKFDLEDGKTDVNLKENSVKGQGEIVEEDKERGLELAVTTTTNSLPTPTTSGTTMISSNVPNARFKGENVRFDRPEIEKVNQFCLDSLPIPPDYDPRFKFPPEIFSIAKKASSHNHHESRGDNAHRRFPRLTILGSKTGTAAGILPLFRTRVKDIFGGKKISS